VTIPISLIWGLVKETLSQWRCKHHGQWVNKCDVYKMFRNKNDYPIYIEYKCCKCGKKRGMGL
jgi:hypothetical protein